MSLLGPRSLLAAEPKRMIRRGWTSSTIRRTNSSNFFEETSIFSAPDLFLYGSFAKNQENPQSDVDLIIIGKTDLDEIEDAISKVERKLGRAVYTTCYSLKEWRKKTGLKDSFLQTVVSSPKIMLIGDENEIR